MSACFSATSGDCTLIRVCPVGLQIIQNSSRVFRAYSYKYALQNIGFSYSDLSPILNLTFAPRKTSYPLPGKNNLTLLRYHVTAFITILYFSRVCKHFFTFFYFFLKHSFKRNKMLCYRHFERQRIFSICVSSYLYVEAFPLVPFTGNACDNDTTDHNYSYNYNCHNGSGRNTITTVTLSAFTLT